MSKVQSGNKTNDDAITASEGARQIASAGGNQATAKAADIAHYRACRASAIATNCGVAQFVQALQELGTGGT